MEVEVGSRSSKRSRLVVRVIVAIGFVTGAAFLLARSIDESGAYQHALEVVQSDVEIRALLGAPLDVRKTSLGGSSYARVGDWIRAEYQFDVRGTKAAGVVRVHLAGEGDRWELTSGVVKGSDGQELELRARTLSAAR
jgi:hypothetical protein